MVYMRRGHGLPSKQRVVGSNPARRAISQYYRVGKINQDIFTNRLTGSIQ